MRPQATLARLQLERARREDRRRLAVSSLAAFVRQAWHVIEGGKRLEWNFHHDAICDHVQIMLEEWRLAGLLPDEIPAMFAEWRASAWDNRRREYIDDMEAHWMRPVDEFVTTPTGAKIYGCGGGRYVQRAQDLAINVGPISLKSRIIMVFAIAWMWLSVPNWEVFCSSGTPSNVQRDSLACRDLITSSWYRSTFDVTWSTFDLKVEVREDQNRIEKWATTAGGSREARGAGTSVTGVHADALFVDDPDDAAGVWSDAARKNIKLFADALGNRVKDPTRPLRLWIQQNLHHEDLTTRLVKDGVPRLAIPVEWKESRRAANYTAPFRWRDPRNVDGELIQPERFTPTFLAAERRRLGSSGYEAQYNCNPIALDAGKIKRAWWRFYTPDQFTPAETLRPPGCQTDVPAISMPETFDRIVIGGDLSFGAIEGDFNALPAWASKGSARFLLPDFWWEQAEFPEAKKALRRASQAHPGAKIVLEKAANGWAVIQELEDEIPGIVAVRPIGSKAQRQAAISPTIESGCGYLPLGHPRLAELVDEFAGATKHDDMSDASAYAIIDLNGGSMATPQAPIAGDAVSPIVVAAATPASPSLYSILGGMSG